MSDRKIAERYANGFVDAFEKKDMQELLVEVRTLIKVLSDNPDLSGILASHVIDGRAKEEILTAFTSESKYKDYWQNLIKLLLLKNRINLFSEIIYFIEQYVLGELNIVKITFKTAHELNKEMQEKMEKFLKSKIDYNIETSFITDPSVIGGFIAESDNFIVDSSVKRSLEQFKLSSIKM